MSCISPLSSFPRVDSAARWRSKSVVGSRTELADRTPLCASAIGTVITFPVRKAISSTFQAAFVASRGLMAAFLFLALSTRAQDSQFLFDANGNQFVQTAAVNALPQILGQPHNRMVGPGESASFFVVAADTRALTYQWQFNGTSIDGATNDALLLPGAGSTNEGEYRVVLTNPSGSLTSAPAMLSMDSDADGVADSWERTYFGSLTNTATGDFDLDGVSNLQELFDGTNPTNSASVRYHLTLVQDGGSVAILPNLSSYTNGQTVTLTATPPANGSFHAWLGDVVTHSNTITVEMTTNKTVYAHFTPVVFTWAGPLSGDWNAATNWEPNLVPGSNDSVVINIGSTVTLDTPADCASVVLGGPDILGGPGNSNPNLTGSGTLTVHDHLYWRSGSMSGSGRTVLETGAALIMDMDNPAGLNLSSRTLELGGETFWTAAANLFLNNAVITNRAGAVFHAAGPGSINFSSRFDNAGTFRKSGNTGTTTFASGATFNNYGTVEIETGTLHCDASFTNNGVVNVSAGATHQLAGGGTCSSTFNAAATALVEWTFRTFTLNPGAQLNGDGLYQINAGGPLNQQLTALFNNADIAVENFGLLYGVLDGSDTITISNAMNWTGGTMSGSGQTIIPPGATLTIADPGTVTLSRTLENGGTILWTGAGDIDVTGGVVITNRAGALFKVENAAGLGGGIANGRLDNAGTFRKSANPGITTIQSGMTFNNYGALDIRSGILVANGGYVSSANALLTCALGGTTAGTGYGQLKVAGAVNLNGQLSVDFAPGFMPATNDTFSVVTAGSRNGQFGSFLFPPFDSNLQLSYTPTSVTIVTTNSTSSVPMPVFLAPEISSSNVTLKWTAVSNVAYRLEFSPILFPLDWTALPGDVIGFDTTASKIDTLTTSNRIYRVRVLP